VLCKLMYKVRAVVKRVVGGMPAVVMQIGWMLRVTKKVCLCCTE
jgi:hypothetical protein